MVDVPGGFEEPLRVQGQEALAASIIARHATVAVVGQGAAGYALGQTVAAAGFRVFGVDADPSVVAHRNATNRQPNYRADQRNAGTTGADVVVVTVPTQTRLSEGQRLPDLTPLISTARDLARSFPAMSPPRLIVFGCTYAPGTTRRVLAPILNEARGAAATLFLGYSPERLDAGNPTYGVENTVRITSGLDDGAASLTDLFFNQFVVSTARAASVEQAEAASVLECSYRLVNIAFAQEFDEYCSTVGLSSREIVDMAASKPFGFMPFYGGVGIGGQGIAESPYHLRAAMEGAPGSPGILSAALRNHERRPEVIVRRITEMLSGSSAGARVLLLGVAYKPDTSDAWCGPALPILDLLVGVGATVEYVDPFIPTFAGRTSRRLEELSPGDFDLAVVLANHRWFDVSRLRRDGWRVYEPASPVQRTPGAADTRTRSDEAPRPAPAAT